MSIRGHSKPIPVVLVLLTASLSILGLYVAGVGTIQPVYATLPVVLGIDCGLGSTVAVPDPLTGVPVADGSLDTTCSWIGDADGDTANDPLVSDELSSFPGVGGGFTIDVRATGLTENINGFDVSLSYDTRYLDAILIDQAGLVFGDSANGPFVLVKSIDRSTGTVRMAEVLLTGGAIGDVTLFRVRFDVVGVGASSLNIFDDVLTKPQAVPHKTLDGSIESVSFFDPSLSLGWGVSWVFSPNPEVPGSPLTFTATTACPGCGALSYSWDTNSNGAADTGEPTGNPATISPPHPIIHRVTLTVSDGSNIVMAVRRLPLTVAVEGPSTIAVNTEGIWTGRWLGGIPTYTGPWRFCPGTATATTVCHRPAPTVPATQGQTNTQTLNQLTSPLGAYHFAGVYTNTLRITDSTRIATPQLGPNDVQVTATFLVEVTGTPQAYTVTVSNPAKADTGQSVSFTATMRYATTYPTGFRSSSFNIVFDFGDGATSATTVSGCSTTEPPDPASPCTASASHTYNVAAATSFNVRVTAQETAPAAISKIQEVGTGSIIINPPAAPLVPDFTFNPADPTVGKPVTFDATATGGTGPYTFNWDFGDGITGNGQSTTHSYATKGPYTAVLTITDSATGSATVSKNIVVVSQPLTIQASCASGATAGKPVECTATASGGTTPYSFSWDVGKDGNIDGTSSIFSFAFPTKGAFSIDAIVRDANDVVASVNLPITVAPQPLAVSVDCPGVGLTAGKPFTCTVSASGGTAPYSGTGAMTVSFPTKGTYPVSFTVTDANAASASGTTTVTIEAQPIVADFSFTPQPPVAGQEATFTATATGGTSPYSFEWNFGDGSPLATGVTVTHAFASDITYTVEVTARDANGFSNFAGKPVDVSPPPVPFDFTVSVDPVSAKMTQGGTVTTLVTVTPIAGTAEIVTLDAFPNSGIGWIISFSTLSGTPPFTSTLTITSGLETVADTYTFVVRGTSATDTIRETTFMVTLNTLSDYSLSVSPTSAKMVQGGTISTEVTVALLFGPGEEVTLDAFPNSGLDWTISFSTVSGTPTFTSTLTITSSLTTVPDTYTFFVRGTSASFLVHETQFILTLNQLSEYSVSVDPTATKVTQGGTTSTLVTVALLSGPGEVVSLEAFPNSGLGWTISFSTLSGTPTFTSTLTITSSVTTVPDTYTFAVRGTSNSFMIHETLFIVTVNQLSEYSISVDPTATKVIQGGTVGTLVTVTLLAGPGETVSLEAFPNSGLGWTLSFSSLSGTPTFTSTLTITSSLATVPDTYTFVVRGRSASDIVHDTTFMVTVNPAPAELTVSVNCPDTGLTAGKPFLCDVSASGGTPPYTGTGQQTVMFSVKGTYTVSLTVTDSAQASATGSDTVTIAAQSLVAGVVCPDTGLTAGKPFMCEVSATGGTSPYSGTGSQAASLPVKGAYVVTFTVTDANGASASGQDSVVVASQPLTVTGVCPDTGLSAGKPFTCEVSATDGTSPYIGTGSQTVVFPVKGTYTVTFTVTDTNGESASGSDSVTISAQPLVATAACPDSGLTEDKPFECEVSATGGTAPYTGTGVFSRTFTEPGTYTVSFTVTDANGASITASDTVEIAPQPPGELIVTVVCPATGLTAGKPFQCDVSATGGTPPYTGTGLQQVSFPAKGTYTVTFTVTDVNGASASGSDSVTIEAQPLVVTVACPDTGLIAGTPFTCDVSATGGTAPYEGTGPIEITIPAKGVQTATFTVTDANGVIASGSDIVDIAPILLTVDFSFSPTSPTAGEPITFTANAVGGTIPYMFSWDFGDGSLDSTHNPATHAYASPGDYVVEVVVLDVNGASDTITHVVTVSPAAPSDFSISVSPGTGKVTQGQSTTTEVTVALTSGPGELVSLEAFPTSGLGFTIAFSTLSGAPTFTSTLTITASLTTIADTYMFIVRGRSATDIVHDTTFTLTVNPAPTEFVVTVSCPNTGLTAGKPFTCTVSATGGTPPYSGTGDMTLSFPSKGSFIITFDVTDANSLTATGSATVVIDSQPLVVDFTFAGPVTAGKPATFTSQVSGGSGPYTVHWDLGADGSFDFTGDVFATSFPAKGTISIRLHVIDSNGADSEVTKSVAVDPQPLVVSVDCPDTGLTAGKPFTCTVSATGGTAPYGGTGAFTVSYPVKTPLRVSFDVIDANAVTATGSDIVTIDPQPLIVIVNCPDAGLTVGKPFDCEVSATGGTTPYTGTGTLSKSFDAPGTYTVTFTVIDANEASADGSDTVQIAPQPPGELVVTVNCPGGGLTTGKPFQCDVSATGGTPPYTGTGAQTAIFNVKGSYTVSFTVTDSLGDTASGSDSVTIDAQPLTVTVSCPDTGLTAGKPFVCIVSATGGTAPYAGTGDLTVTIPTKGAAPVSFDVTDANLVTATGSVTVIIDSQPLIVTVECPFGLTAGKLFDCNVSATGGTGPYTGTGLREASFPVKGTYTVSFDVTDSNLVTATGSTMVTIDPQPLLVDFAFSPTSPTAGDSVTFTATVTGGTGPYSFSWDFGDEATGSGNPAVHTYSSPGDVTVQLTITDANGANAIAGHALSILPQPVAAVLLTFDGCDVDAFVNGVGELRVFINGDFVIDIPAGLHGLTGTGEYAPHDGVCVSFGPFDITSSIQQGVNTLVFQNPLSDHYSKIKNVRVVQDDLVFLFDTRIRNSSPGTTEVLTFSVPPLVLTGFQTGSAAFVTEPVTFTATFTGGTGPFKCTFSFGDGDSKSVTTSLQSCSATHTYWSVRFRTATVRVRGATVGDDVRGSLLVKVEPQPGYSSSGLLWRSVITDDEQQTFTAGLTNPASVPVLIRLDFTITRPDGSKETFISPSFALNPGQTLTGLSFNYAPSGGLGSYCFKAPLKYGTDTNNNGVLEDGELLGKRTATSGCFHVVNAASLAISPFLFFGTALLPKARSKIGRYFGKKNSSAS